MATTSTGSADAPALDHGTIGQLSYHLRCSAGLACSSDVAGAAAHTLLSWALLDVIGGDELRTAVTVLDLPDHVGDLGCDTGRPILASAQQLALQLVSHFTSTGRHDLAGLYQDAFGTIGAVPPVGTA